MRRVLFALVIASSAQVASAQNTLPGLENFTLERPSPTPTPVVTPAPTPTPSPTASPTPAATATTPVTIATRRDPRPQSADPNSPSPAPTVAAPTGGRSNSEPGPAPFLTPTPTPTPATTEAPPPPPAAEASRWLWRAALAGALFAGLAGLLWWRRRTVAAPTNDFAVPVGEDRSTALPARTTERPSSAPQPVAPPPPASVAPPKAGGLVTSALKPEILLSLEPARGGVDTLRATLEFQLRLTNAGRGTARAVTVEAWLTSGSHETDAELGRLFAGPRGEPMLPPFDLPASAAIDLTGQLTIPREALAVITAGDRRSFVPIVAARAEFADGRGLPTITTGTFLIGLARDGQERLAALPLDRGARMHDRLAARPY